MCHDSSSRTPPPHAPAFFASTMENTPQRSRHAFAQTRTPMPGDLPSLDERRHPARVTSPSCTGPTAVATAAARARHPAPQCPSSCECTASNFLGSDANKSRGPPAHHATMLSSYHHHHHHHHHHISPVPTVDFLQARGDHGADDDNDAGLTSYSFRRRRPHASVDGRRKDQVPAGGSSRRGDQDAMSVAIPGSLTRKSRNGGGGGPYERKHSKPSARASAESLPGIGERAALGPSPEYLNQAIFLAFPPYAGSDSADERIFRPHTDEISSSQSRRWAPGDLPALHFHPPPLGHMLSDEPLPNDTAYDPPESPRLRARTLPGNAVPDIPESPRLDPLGSDFDEDDEVDHYQPIVPSFPFSILINKFPAASTELTEASLRKLDVMRHTQKYSLRGTRYPGHRPSPLGPFWDRFHGRK